MASSEPSSAPTPVQWELPAPDPSHAKFKDQVDFVVDTYKATVLEKHLGPMQYLETKLQETSSREAFVAWLWQAFPLDPSKAYNLESPFPSVDIQKLGDSLPCKTHISMLGFDAPCSLKPPPAAHSSLELAQHILNDGFRTSGKPLLVKHIQPVTALEAPWKDEANGMPVEPLSLGYVKGMLRATTCLALLHLFWEDGNGEALLNTFQVFRESVGCIYVHHVAMPSLESEVFNNFLLSIRDSLSKPPNFMTWLHTLRTLKTKGYEDSSAVISRFNQMVPKSSWLIGSKATALGNFMALFPDDLIMMLQNHVSKWGWEGCCLTDDAMSTKKILPNASHKAPHKTWKKLCSMNVKASLLTFAGSSVIMRSQALLAAKLTSSAWKLWLRQRASW